MAAEHSPQYKSSDSIEEDYTRDSEKTDTISAPIAAIDHAAERKLVRKLDLYIMPLFFFLYMLCFLDRWVWS